MPRYFFDVTNGQRVIDPDDNERKEEQQRAQRGQSK
jgi:hypothetical protein